MPNSTVYALSPTLAFEAPDHRDLMHEEIHQRLGGAGFHSPPPPLGSGSDDRAALIAWLASLPADTTVGFQPGYLLSARLPLPDGHRYIGRGVAEGIAGHFTLMNGSNPAAAIDGVIVSKAWDDNNNFGGVPTIYENLSINGNAANNTGTYSGIIPFNFWSRIRDCRIDSPRLHHIYLSKFKKDGTEATALDFADNRIYGNRFRNGLTGTDGAMIRHAQPSGGNHNADIRAWDNHGESLQHGFLIDNAAGWSLFDNHVWCRRHGINISNGMYDSRVWGNYVDAFGVDNAAATTYYGIRCRGFEGPGGIVYGNHVDSADTVSNGTHYCYYLEAQNANAHIAGGFNEATTHGNAANLHGFVYGANNGLVYVGQWGNVALVDAANGFAAGQDFEKVESGGGTVVMLYPRPMHGTGTWNPGSVAAGAVSTQTITVTGAQAGDVVAIGFTPALATPSSWRVWAMVTGTNTVTAFFENRSGGAITPSSTTVRATVWNPRA